MFFLNQIYYNIASPPLTWMVCPVTYSDLSDTKNSTQFATSKGDPIFPIGIFSINDFRWKSMIAIHNDSHSNDSHSNDSYNKDLHNSDCHNNDPHNNAYTNNDPNNNAYINNEPLDCVA